MLSIFHLSLYKTDECKIQFEKEYIADGFVANHYQYSLHLCKLLLVIDIIDNKVKIKEQYDIDDVEVTEFE